MRPTPFVFFIIACGGAEHAAPDTTTVSGDAAAVDDTIDVGADTIDVGAGTIDVGADTVAAAEVDAGPRAPEVESGASDPLPLPQATENDAALGFRVSGRVHPAGRPATWYVEYGGTSAHGSRTPPRALPGRLTAHYREDWTGGLAGWAGGFLATALVPREEAGRAFLRYTDRGAEENDVNHLDGVGLIHLPMYAYPGNVSSGVPEQPSLYLGGGHPDFRGARFSLDVRGVDWVPKGTTLGTWVQMDLDPGRADQVPMRRANWAHTGEPFGDLLASGRWETARWTLRNHIADWTYAGQYGARNAYLYKELDAALADVNVDFFPAQLLFVDLYDLPSGAIDFDALEITYRNHSVLAGSNGGHLVASPAEGDAGALTDGWRFGDAHEWTGPAAPVAFRYALDRPVTLRSVLIHNSVEAPSTLVEVRVSADGSTFASLGERELPTTSPHGPNFLFHHELELDPQTTRALPLHPAPIVALEVIILAGPDGAERWGLGEIEAFGEGAIEETDDDWYDVNLDIVAPPGVYHYRIVVTTDAGTAYGDDVMVEVPALPPPVVTSVYPAILPSAGGEYLQIYGENLAHQLAFAVDGLVIEPWGVARGVMAALIPPGHGSCDITVTTEFGTTTYEDGVVYDDGTGQPDPGECRLAP